MNTSHPHVLATRIQAILKKTSLFRLGDAERSQNLRKLRSIPWLGIDPTQFFSRRGESLVGHEDVDNEIDVRNQPGNFNFAAVGSR